MPTEPLPLRVLIVDDEPLTTWSLSETLVDGGDVVTEARSGEAAIRALTHATETVDVVLLDYCLPDSCNLRLLSTIKRLSPRSQVILMSAYYSPEIEKEALALGAYRVLSKPFDMKDVPGLVRDAAGACPPSASRHAVPR